MKAVMISVPGSGKTTAIAEYITEMVGAGSIRPECTYAVSFTREAASELRGRIRINGVEVSTIHSLAHAVLSTSGGVPSDLSSLDNMFYDELLIRATKSVPGMVIDFLAIDEAQDLSKIQFNFLIELAKIAKHVLVVGDPWQSIFSFQGSNPAYMGEFERVIPGVDIISRSTSYRLPKEISFFVNNTFNPNVHISPVKEGGVIKTHVLREDILMTMLVSQITENSGILLRTNAEIISLLRKLGPRSKEVNYSVPLSAHPFVTFASAIVEMGTSVPSFDLLQASNLLGGMSWSGTRTLRKLGDRRFTRPALEDIFGPGRITTLMDPKEMPIVGPKVRKEIYNLIEVLDEYSSFFGSVQVDSIVRLLERIRSDKYLIEDFWNTGGVTDEEIAEAVRRRILTRSELYHSVNNNSSINIMTIHAAKGKEFDHVLVPVNTKSVSIHEQEEFRILYVACTRAKERLSIFVPESYTHDRSKANIIDTMNRSAGFI